MVGQEVVIQARSYAGTEVLFGYRVKRITPTGQTVVERGGDEMRFDKSGREIGRKSSWGFRYSLRFDVEECKRLHLAQSWRNEAVDAIVAISSDKIGRQSTADEIQAVINRARLLADRAQAKLDKSKEC